MHYKFWQEEAPPPQETFSRAFDAYRSELDRLPADRTKPPRFGRLAGLLLGLGLAFYGVAEQDIPVLCLTVAVLAFSLKEAAGRLAGPYGPAVANGLQGFAVVLGLGAVVLLVT